MARIVVVGGGICGLATALFLGRRGHEVTVLEKDSRTAGHDLEHDFFDWHRPAVPQAIQPHSLLSPVRTVLREEAPDVYETMLQLGAEEWHELDRFAHRPPPRPGDEDLVTIRARRIIVEQALAAAVQRQPEVTIAHSEPATGLIIEASGQQPHVAGVYRGAGPLTADLVIDASGRRSPLPGWLTGAGARAPVVDTHRAGIAYFCRWYRLHPSAPRHPATTTTGGSTPFALGGVFPSDNGVFAVHLAVSTSDPTRAALRDPAVFEAVAQTFPGCADWLALTHDPVGPVLVMAGLDNRRTALVDNKGPIVTGLLAVGDSVLHTSPTLGLGIPFGLRTAAWVAAHADQPADDELTIAHHQWTTSTLGPWFDHQVTTDKAGGHRLRHGSELTNAETGPATENPEEELRAALPWCALEDAHVMRARARVRHLLDLPQDAYAAPEIQERVAAWLIEHPNFEPPRQGPDRAQRETLTAVPTT
ncbi:FAD-dependent oxidoreductase [Nocardia grenadensis]|uniref:FAD-dependent oxidoreductase n=1 Tax=Nocardia grenadensis TaxID=931537 RepID=UPI0007A3EBE1|nr:FAD-dependent oxidoreductase [Nocardia grenadensis]